MFGSTCLSLILLVQSAIALEVQGALSLESLTFYKVVKSFKSTLVKFDEAYAHGKSREGFEIVAKLSAKVDDLMVAEVAVNEYGERENQDLADRFKIDRTKYPQYMLFTGNVEEPIIHDGGYSHFELIRFLRKNGIYLGLDGCSEELDAFAAQFMGTSGNNEARKTIYEKLQKVVSKYKGDELEHGTMYVSLMKNMIGKGNDFVQKNIDRMISIIEGNNVAKNKKEKLEKKVNILECFLLSTAALVPNPKDEL